MNEVDKLYRKAGVEKEVIRGCFEYYAKNGGIDIYTVNDCKNKDCNTCKADKSIKEYPPFTAEKQLEIENVILQNKRNYNKWIEYNINVYGEWVIRFVRTDKFAPYIALGKTRAEAFANVINHFWQDLTNAERTQIKNILESEVRE